MKMAALIIILSTITLATTAYGQCQEFVPGYPGSDGLIAYFGLNGDANDCSGNGWNGVIHGSPTFVQTESPFSNQAILMNGSTDYVALDADLVPDYFTLGMWINTTTTAMGGESSPLLARLRMDGFALFLNYYTLGDMGIDLYNSDTSHYVAAVDDVILNDGRWHHICVCYGPERGLEIYIDGQWRLGDDSQGVTPLYASSSAVLTLSRDANVSAHYYQGMMDEVVFYDHALTSSEVDRLFLDGLTVPSENSAWGDVKAMFR